MLACREQPSGFELPPSGSIAAGFFSGFKYSGALHLLNYAAPFATNVIGALYLFFVLSCQLPTFLPAFNISLRERSCLVFTNIIGALYLFLFYLVAIHEDC